MNASDSYAVGNEKQGQIEFYRRVLLRVNPNISMDEVISDDNDGVINGNLLEFKLSVWDLNAHLFQSIKYLSAMRIKGKPVPANILIIDLSTATAWHYLSAQFLAYIEVPYAGAASKENSGFVGGNAVQKLRYENNSVDAEKLIALLKEDKYTKIHIDENCIVGWAERFYDMAKGARKEDFIGDYTGVHKTIGEIRSPRIFANYIYPYEGKSNVKFNYLMDKLNDVVQKKDLGAFYTPELYAKKALELVRRAIARVPAGNDYIILDRCAGTGNLELFLTDDELSHCIVSTVEYYEYKVLQELLSSKVRHIIPPFESDTTFVKGVIPAADALSKKYIYDDVIKQYVDNPNCTIILFENPPYAETTSIEHQRRGVGKISSGWKNSYVVQEMKKEVKGPASNDMGNAFIWSAFKYYLRQPTDSYVVFSPAKYWKAQHLINKKFLGGFAFNRRHFHANCDACIMCVLWANEDVQTAADLTLTGYDIEGDKLIEYPEKLPVKRINTLYSEKYYDKRIFEDDLSNGIITEHKGFELTHTVQIRVVPKYNENILCYMIVSGSGFDNPDLCSCLTIAGIYSANGFFVRKDNYLNTLPMFAASRYITYNREWTERARIMKSADGAKKYFRDVANGKLKLFLLKCLLFTCLEMQNHMRTFTGSDGRFYRNELCFDGTNGETIALRDIKSLNFNENEARLMSQWQTVLDWAKKAKSNERGGGYNSASTYGVYQIRAELDTSYKNKRTPTIYDNPELHSALNTLKTLVGAYYNAEIVPVLFEYEYLK